jgi:hypothetical protein
MRGREARTAIKADGMDEERLFTRLTASAIERRKLLAIPRCFRVRIIPCDTESDFIT